MILGGRGDKGDIGCVPRNANARAPVIVQMT
jgi:hypothetical protein